MVMQANGIPAALGLTEAMANTFDASDVPGNESAGIFESLPSETAETTDELLSPYTEQVVAGDMVEIPEDVPLDTDTTTEPESEPEPEQPTSDKRRDVANSLDLIVRALDDPSLRKNMSAAERREHRKLQARLQQAEARGFEISEADQAAYDFHDRVLAGDEYAVTQITTNPEMIRWWGEFTARKAALGLSADDDSTVYIKRAAKAQSSQRQQNQRQSVAEQLDTAFDTFRTSSSWSLLTQAEQETIDPTLFDENDPASLRAMERAIGRLEAKAETRGTSRAARDQANQTSQVARNARAAQGSSAPVASPGMTPRQLPYDDLVALRNERYLNGTLTSELENLYQRETIAREKGGNAYSFLG